MSRAAIRAEGLTKLYRRMAPGFPLRTLKSAFLEGSLTAGLRPEETIRALDGLSFEVAEGEAFSVIGSNGSGKSTLLKVLAGILKPTEGSVAVGGRLGALIELGAGFHPEISGRENIFINGAVLGLRRREVERRFEEIVEFSGLADFIDEPVKHYSSGMYVRLGFAVAIHTDPDILLVDEVLAVGDEAFTHRCLRRIEEFLARGKTLLLVSHSLSLVEEISDRVLWLDGGRLRLIGSPRRVADAYREAVAEAEGRRHREAKEERERALAGEAAGEAEGERPGLAEGPVPEATGAEVGRLTEEEPRRWGSREAEIVRVRLLDGEDRERYNFASGEAVTFELEVRAAAALSDFVFGVGITTPRGLDCWGTNTHVEGFWSSRFEGSGRVRLTCPALSLGPGEYLLDVAVHARDGKPYDYHRRLLAFTVTSEAGGIGIYFPEHRWEFEGGIAWSTVPRAAE